MPGVYGGLIVILVYGAGAIDQELYLITQDGLDILTSTNQRILVKEP